MIGKQIKGKGFLGLLHYALNPEKGAMIGGNMDGMTARELSKEFAESRKLNPCLKRPVYHSSLSLAPGEIMNNFEWNQVVDSYLEKMGFKYSQYIVVRHIDKEHDHVHVIASRIGLNGKTVSDSLDYQRSEKAIREIERDYGLQQVISSHDTDRRGLTSGELHRALKTQKPSIRMQLQEIIDQEIMRSLTMTHLVKALEERGVKVIPNMAGNGRISGLSFCFNNETMKASDLGRGFTFSGLQRRGIHFDQYRDIDVFVPSRLLGLKSEEQYSERPAMMRQFKR